MTCARILAIRLQISIGYCVVVALIALGVGCGDDGGQDQAPSAGSSGSMAGSQAGGGSGRGGAGSNASGSGGAGQAGSGGAGQAGSNAGNHCSPGTVYYVGGDLPSFLSVESNCDERDIDGDGEDDHINSISLPEPMRPGESYAFSGLRDTGGHARALGQRRKLR